MKYLLPAMAFLAMAPGCAYIKPSTDARAEDRYETYAPKFTDEQKSAMSHEELVGKYNDNVRAEERLVCRRQTVVGTHFRKTVCTTSQERSEEVEAAGDYIREHRISAIAQQPLVQTRGIYSAQPLVAPLTCNPLHRRQ